MNKYPEKANVAIRWNEIIRRKEAPVLTERASSRMVKIAAHLPENEFIGWQMAVSTDGPAKFESFGSAAIKVSDLEWIAEETAKTSVIEGQVETGEKVEGVSDWNLYEIHITAERKKISSAIGFNGSTSAAENETDTLHTAWPTHFSRQFGEFVRALRSEGAMLRYSVGRATFDEQKKCEKTVISTWGSGNIAVSEYIGSPVRAKVLLLMPNTPSARLCSVVGEFVPGADIKYVGNMSDSKCKEVWENPMSEPRVVPDIAARILALEPIIGETPVIGVESCNSEAKPIPAGHQNSVDKHAIRIGKALGTSGLVRDVTIGDADLRRHWQIIGQTGTGKSTLLAGTILEAVKGSRGVTFFDPHGSTIDIILECVPQKFANRIRVVRVGDCDNPVPMNMWHSENPDDCEKIISDLNLLFADIFDPKRDGFVGPRWERWFSVFASAAISLLGKYASFDSIITISQGKETMRKLYNAIKYRNPKAALAIKSEYYGNNSSDFGDTINWCISKFQRLTAVPQLRSTLGAGANALDFEKTVDTNTVTLIDLASPVIGTHASRVIGTLLLLQLWNAVMSRKDRNRTHVLAIDEAHLFQTNPLPQMLAEGRKFGVGMILSHQHCGQLSREVRDALDANSASFSAFKLSVKDAHDAVNKFDDCILQNDLSRLNAFNAITTLSVDNRQTEAFTLQIEKPKKQRYGAAMAAEIERRSIEALVDPYRSCRALTASEVIKHLEVKDITPLPPYSERKTPIQPEKPVAAAVAPLVKKLRDIAKGEIIDEAV